jgi:hypothetical protein
VPRRSGFGCGRQNPNTPSSTGLSPGEIAVSCTPVHSIALLTGTSRALSKIGRHVTSAAFDLASFAKQVWANPRAPEWFRIVAIDAAGRRAWTNPIWIDELAGG